LSSAESQIGVSITPTGDVILWIGFFFTQLRRNVFAEARLSERYGGKKRLAACVPWVKALASKVFGLETVVASGKLRFVVIDGSSVQVPGAAGTSSRLHIAIDLVKLALLQVEVSTDKIGESLAHYSIGNGDVVIIDRGYNQPKSLVPFVDQGGDIVLRYNPHGMTLCHQHDGMAKIDWGSALKKLGG